MEDKLKHLIKEYSQFRKVVFLENFKIFRPQIIHVLYVVYKRIIRRIFIHWVQKATKSDKEMMLSLLDSKEDFYFSFHYKEEISYLESIYEHSLYKDIFKKDEKLK